MRNLRRSNANEARETFNRSKNVTPMFKLYTRYVDGCIGGCEV